MSAGFDVDALRAAVAGIDQGSFARAAIELGRSQSAVSMQLKKLEHQAGVQLFVRKGRGLVPTEAGDALLKYARRIIALNDEAARALGSAVAPETVRLGLPQDFYDDVMPATVDAFSQSHPDIHLTVHAGNNHTIYDDVMSGRLDGAIAFFPEGSDARGELLCALPLLWVAHKDYRQSDPDAEIPLVLFNHGCLIRQKALDALEKSRLRSRAVLTTPSLAAVWAALRSGFGIGVRVGHSLPSDIVDVSAWPCLPSLPKIELRLLGRDFGSPMSKRLLEVLRVQTMTTIARTSEGPRP